MFHFSGYQQFLSSSSSIKTPNLGPAFDANGPSELETADMNAIADVRLSSKDRLVTCDLAPAQGLQFHAIIRI